MYRVVLEALTNVIRHARLAGQATVTLAHDRRAVTIDVTDDAPAATVSSAFTGSGGYGLTGMRERVEALGGTLRAGPQPTATAGTAGPAGPAVRLSARETEVAQAIARGRTNQEIAAGLFVSLSTVKTHLASIQAKPCLRNRVEIAAWAWEKRIIEQ